MEMQERLTSMKPSDKVIASILLVVAVGAFGGGLYYVLPTLILLAENTITFIVELAVAAMLAMVVFDKNTWRNAYYGWKNLSRRIRKSIISSDPIGILDTVIHRYDGKLVEIDDSIVTADGAKRRQADAIKASRRSRDEELGLAKEAQKRGKDLQVSQHATASDRWEQAAVEMEPTLEMLSGALTCMQRARDLCDVQLSDLKNQKLVMQRKLEALVSGQSAIRKIKRFMGNNPDLEMQELAVEDIERKATEAMAEIDQFMRIITPQLESNDLKNAAAQSAAMDKFNRFMSGQPALPETKEQPKQLAQALITNSVKIPDGVQTDSKQPVPLLKKERL